MEDVILTRRVLAARSTVRLSEFLAIGKSFSLVLWSFVVMVTAQASVVIMLRLHPQKGAEDKPVLPRRAIGPGAPQTTIAPLDRRPWGSTD